MSYLRFKVTSFLSLSFIAFILIFNEVDARSYSVPEAAGAADYTNFNGPYIFSEAYYKTSNTLMPFKDNWNKDAATGNNSIVFAGSPIPTITSATYDYNSNVLTVTGTNFVDNAGANNDVDISLLTFTGDGTGTYTLTSTTDVEITSATEFSVTLSGTDLTHIEALLNKDGISSAEGTTYNIAAAEDWLAAADPAENIADLTGNGITVNNFGSPTIALVNYYRATGKLKILGINFVSNAGALDVDASLINIKGEGNLYYTLTNTSDVEITSDEEVILFLSDIDQLNINGVLNKADGTHSANGTTYVLNGADNWMTGSPDENYIPSDSFVLFAFDVIRPTVTSATYNYGNNILAVTGTNLFKKLGANNDVDVSKLTITGEGAGTYTLTSTTDVEITSATEFSVTLSGADLTNIEALLNKNGTGSADGTTYNIAAAEDWLSAADPAENIADMAGNGITVFISPTITSATYNANSGALEVTGTDIQANFGGSDIDASKFTFTGEGGETYTLTNTPDVERNSISSLTLNLSATDRNGVSMILNKNGTVSSSGTTYNIAAGNDWCTNVLAGNTADITANGITVSNVQIPTITSATYDYNSNVLTVTGTNFVSNAGANNDVDISLLTFTGESTGTYTLTSTSDVEITSATEFSVTLSGADLTHIAVLLNKDGISSADGTTYNLAAAEDWLRGADAATNIADMAGNGITVSNAPVNAPPVINNLTGDNVLIAAGGGAEFIDESANATVSNADAADCNGGKLTISQNTGTANGSFYVDGTNVTSGGDAVISASETIVVGGTSIGTVHAANDGQGGNSLQIIFNTNSNNANIQTLLRNLKYAAPSGLGARIFLLTLNDNDGTANGGDEDGTANFTITMVEPEINLHQGFALIALGGSYNYGIKALNSNNDIIFTISNTGEGILSVTTPLTIGGADSGQFSIQSQPSATVAAHGSTTFTVRFTPSSAGAKTATIAISNNDMDENPYDLTLNGTGNAPPTGSNNAVTIFEDIPFSFNVNDFTFNDANGDNFAGIKIESIETSGDLEYNGADVVAGQVYPNTALLKFTSEANRYASPYSVFTFKVIDDMGGYSSVSYQFTINVLSVNDAPDFTASNPPAITEDAGEQIIPDWAVFNAGPDDENFLQKVENYFVKNVVNSELFTTLPSVDSNGTLKYKIAENANGTASFAVSVKDNGGTDNGGTENGGTENGGTENGGTDSSSSQTFTLTVHPVNDAPEFTASNPPTIKEDAGEQIITNWAVFNAGSDDEDSIQTVLVYTLDNLTNPELFSTIPSINTNGTLIYKTAENANGVAIFEVIVTDNGGIEYGGENTSQKQSFIITVLSVNDAPDFTASNPPAITEDAGEQIIPDWAVFNAGPDDEDSLQMVKSYIVTNISNPELFSEYPNLKNDGSLTYNIKADKNGTSTFDVAVIDNGGVAEGGVDSSTIKTFAISVSNLNDEPTTIGIPNIQVNEDSENTILDLSKFFEDADQDPSELKYTITLNSNLFNSFSIKEYNLIIDYEANNNGSSIVQIMATDNMGKSVKTSFQIFINSVNDAPVAIGISNIELSEDSENTIIDLSKCFADVDQYSETLSYSIENITNGELFSSVTVNGNNLVLDYFEGKNGTAVITVIAKDKMGLYTDTTFTVTITPVNDAPKISPVPVIEINEDEQFVINYSSLYNFVSDDETESSDIFYRIT
ncbi:MAG: choice-of-anchor D domain-containing protein [Melioribacteraceae bacterium]|nr:choice-of-anchor D domain-containing protein [Melioribacteraceae bacterium]